jgi:hypothetical protein
MCPIFADFYQKIKAKAALENLNSLQKIFFNETLTTLIICTEQIRSRKHLLAARDK